MAPLVPTKPIPWAPHALEALAAREIDRGEAERSVANPEFIAPGVPPRRVHMRRYFDVALRQERLLRIVVEETVAEVAVVTADKTSNLRQYLKGFVP